MANNQEPNLDRDWSVTLDLGGLTAPRGKVSVNLPQGYYKAKITDAYVNPERNSNRVIFKLTVAEGPFSGVIRTHGLGIPKSDDDNVRYYWRGMAESAGYTPAELDSGEVSMGLKSFKGRTVHMHYTPKGEEGTGTEYDQVDLLTPSEWNQQRQAAEASSTSTSPSGGNVSASSGTVSKNDLVSQLGL